MPSDDFNVKQIFHVLMFEDKHLVVQSSSLSGLYYYHKCTTKDFTIVLFPLSLAWMYTCGKEVFHTFVIKHKTLPSALFITPITYIKPISSYTHKCSLAL